MYAIRSYYAFAVADSLAVAYPPGAVWTVLTGVEQWPQWWPGVQGAKVDPALQVGATLTLLLAGNADRSPATVEAVTPARHLVWRRPGVLGSTVRTTLRLEPQGGGALVALESAIVGPQALLASYNFV